MKVVLSSQRAILLDVQGSNVWSGQAIQSYNSDAISWGALGKTLYAPGTRYGFVPWMILVGLGFPIPFWLLHRYWPKVGWNSVYTPVLVAELGILSVGINSSTFSSFIVAILSQWYLRKYRPRWFRKCTSESSTSYPCLKYAYSCTLPLQITSCSAPPWTVELKSWFLSGRSPSVVLLGMLSFSPRGPL